MAHIALIAINDRCSLGLRTLSAIAKHHGHRASIVFFGEYDTRTYSSTMRCDLAGDKNYAQEEQLLVRLVAELAPDVVGISFRSVSEVIALDLAGTLKARFPALPIILGGIGPTSNPEECIGKCDAICIGEGDLVLPPLLEVFARVRTPQSRDFIGVPNLWINDGESTLRTERTPLVSDLDSVPDIDYDARGKYTINARTLVADDGRYDNELGAYPLLTSRGCPYTCTYCHNSLVKKLYGKEKYLRRRSVDSVIDELVREKSRNPALRMISIYDDSFPMQAAWLRDFAGKYRRLIGLPYWCFAYPTTLTREKIELLVGSGCNSICIGCQSFSSQTLRLYNRTTDLARLQQVLALLREYPVNVQIDLISFNPLESEEDKRATFDFLLALEKNTPFSAPPDRRWGPSISRLTLFPHTEIYERIASRRKVTGEYAPDIADPRGEAFWEMLYRLAFHDYLPCEELLALSWQRHAFLSVCRDVTVEEGIRYVARRLLAKGAYEAVEGIISAAERWSTEVSADVQRLVLSELRAAEEHAAARHMEGSSARAA